MFDSFPALPVAVVLCTLASTAAEAQTPERRWELEVHGGALLTATSDNGDGALPPPNTQRSLSAPTAARIVSSWFFGDGASQVNATLASGRSPVSLVPLDVVLRSRLAQPESGASFGLRIGRHLGGRLGAEFSLEAAAATASLGPDSLAGMEASRVTFANVFNTLFGSGSGSGS